MEKAFIVILLVVLTLVAIGYAVNYYVQRMNSVKNVLGDMESLYSSVMVIDDYNATHVLAVVKNAVTVPRPVPVLVNTTWIPKTQLQPGDIVLIPKP